MVSQIQWKFSLYQDASKLGIKPIGTELDLASFCMEVNCGRRETEEGEKEEEKVHLPSSVRTSV